MGSSSINSLKIFLFYKINPLYVLFAVQLFGNCSLEWVVQFMHNLFDYDEEMSWGMQGYPLCLLDNLLRVATVAVRV